MTVAHQTDPIVDPERLFEGFENVMPMVWPHPATLRIVIMCHIMKLCL
jgi:hypothetical protein